MKKKFKSILLLLLVALLAVFTLAGCASYRKSKAELTAGLVCVRYYANGGKINDDSVRDLYYKPGTKAFEIGVDKLASGKLTMERMNYTFGGWYFVQLDGDGEPVYLDEAKTQVKLTDEKADFSVAVKDGDDWVVGARWIAHTKVYIKLACDEGETLQVKQTEDRVELDKTYVHGDTVLELAYENDGVARPPSKLFTVNNRSHTFLAYYQDEACTQLVTSWEQTESDVTVYAKYITGDWTIVKTSNDLSSMFNSLTAGKRYWLFTDINASKLKVNAVDYSTAPIGLDCEIKGNGYKISNLTVVKSSIENGKTVAMFGAIGQHAKVTDLTFENVKVEYNVIGASVSLYFVFSDIADGAQISNVKISGTMSIEKSASSTIDNMYAAEGYDYTNCLFGDEEDETYLDADYIASSGGTGFIVEGEAKDFVVVD